MKKVIKQDGKDSTIDLNWAADQAQQCYNLLFGYFDEIVKPHTVKEKETISDNCKVLVNNLVKTMKMATLLADEETVLQTIFGLVPVEVVEIETEE